MFLKKQDEKDYETKLYEARIAVLRNSLATIEKMDYRKEGAASGDGGVDYELIARMVKTQARLALDIESNLILKKEIRNE